jgi:hypothetical protein
MKLIVALVQRARGSCQRITSDDFMDSILPVAIPLIALLMTVGLAIPVIKEL